MNPSATPDPRSIDEEINKQIQNTLQPGETVLWTCKASVKNAIQGELIGRYIGNYIFLICFIIATVGLFEWIFEFFIGGLIISMITYAYLKNLSNHCKNLETTVYVVTDRHAMIVGPNVEIYPVDLLRHAMRRHDSNRNGRLSFYRYYLSGGESPDEVGYKGFDEIYNIGKAEKEIKSILSKKLAYDPKSKIIVNHLFRLNNPSESEIVAAIESLQSKKQQYLMISRGENESLWIICNNVARFVDSLRFFVEYREAESDTIYRSSSNYWDRDKVISLIIKYLNDDDEWKNGHRFEVLPNPEPNKSVTKPESNKTVEISREPRPWFSRFVVILLVIVGVVLFVDDLLFVRRAKETTGEVVSMHSDGKAFFRVVKFHVGGKSYQSKMGWGSSHPSFSIGDNVIVLYDPNDLRDPPRAKMKGLQTETKMMVGCFVLTLFLVSIIYYLRIRSNIKIRKIVGLESRFLEIPRNPI